MEAMMDAGAVEEVIEPVESTESTPVETDDPYSSKASRAYSEWLKNQRELHKDDPMAAKFLRQSKDNHARLYGLMQREPRGIQGVQETYAALDSIIYDHAERGQLKGLEAANAIQSELDSVREIDGRLMEGDRTALQEMGEEFVQQALPKLAGPILEMVRDSNPEAYAAAVLPHFVEALKSSELVGYFDQMVDILNSPPPKWMTANQKTDWIQEQLEKILPHATNASKWFRAQDAKVQQLGQFPKQQVPKTAEKPNELDTLRKEQETQHWNSNIQPNLDKHADSAFQKLFAPYAKRLKLDGNATSDLKQSFIQAVVKKSVGNPVYASQMQRYHSQRKPDANTVSNFAKVEFDKHAKTVMDSLVNQRYKPYLNGGAKPAIAQPTNGAKRPPVGANVQIVTQKPSNIDFKNTPLDWIHQKKYRTTDGKVVQWQR